MASVKVVLRKKAQEAPDDKKNSSQFLYLRVLIDRKARFYSLKKEINPGHWMSKENKVSSKNGNSLFLF